MLNKSPPPIISAVREASLTYLKEEALRDLYDRVRQYEDENADGVILEAGCALGGSAIVLATAKTQRRPLYVYDVFGMIPPPSARDGKDVHERYKVIRSGRSEGIGGEKYYGYEEDLVGKVADNFRLHGVPIEENNVHLVSGLFQDTLDVPDKVILAHIDGDWYESVKVCLSRITPHLVSGGVIVVDDYHTWSGCREAVDEYFDDKSGDYEFVFKSRLHIIRR